MFNIVAKTDNPRFPAYVQNSFTSPEAMIDAINAETDPEQLFIWSECGFAVSSKNIRVGKSIPADCIKAANYDLIKGMSLSSRQGAKEAAAKLEAAKKEWESQTERYFICEDFDCLWGGWEEKCPGHVCPDCGKKVSEQR